MATTCLLYGGLEIDFFKFIFYVLSLYQQNVTTYNDENMAKNCWAKFCFHEKPWTSFDERLSLYRRILEFEQKFLPRIRRPIEKVVVPITTKIWPKTARKFFLT